MPPKAADKDNSKFLYSILKQINTKGVNWEQVAQENDIPTANAASMRWYRYQVSMSPDGKTPPKKKVEGNDGGETGEGEGAGATKKKRPRKRKAVEPAEGDGGSPNG
ncbi:hypothetical protein B9Z19DRAFT_1196707 [Tuber borchii]|uniref:Myb-like DNA-binding domain-containing protein n=1 Tax=Tuber borchii TaxID=42251 RepID=A0A2T6ZDZ4_TUBBO|nr:hypothetical protein B9Z19DRAFT_1196707 [Tuber borchii]